MRGIRRGCALVLLAAAALPALHSQASTRWFESDAAGFQGAALAAAPVAGQGPEWLLALTRDGDREERLLTREGGLVERQTVEALRPGAEARLASGKDAGPGARIRRIEGAAGLEREEIIGADGSLLEERFFAPPAGGGPVAPPALREALSYFYAGKLLRSVEARDAAGLLTGSLTHRYDALGRLVEVRATGSLGQGAAGLLPASTGPRATWARESGLSLALFYDRAGRIVAAEERAGEKLLRRETWTYGEGRQPKTSLLLDAAAGTEESRIHDAAGRILSSETRLSADSPTVSRLERVYDASGLLLVESLRVAGRLEERRYLRAAGDEPSAPAAREELRVNGQLESVTLRSPGGGRVEELYAQGELFVRAYYEGLRRLREEFYAGGELVRVREEP